MMFQSYALYPHMKVFDNMAFWVRIQKNNQLLFCWQWFQNIHGYRNRKRIRLYLQVYDLFHLLQNRSLCKFSLMRVKGLLNLRKLRASGEVSGTRFDDIEYIFGMSLHTHFPPDSNYLFVRNNFV